MIRYYPTQIDLLKKYRLPVRGFSGQNFLIDPNIQKKIVDLLGDVENQKILEIGPGLGALTFELLERGAKVFAVEKDPRFVEVLEKELQPFLGKNLVLITGDFLKTDIEKIPGLFNKKKEKIRIIGNLPYYITTPILFRLVEESERIEQCVLTLQKEVAGRLTAQPGSKAYSRLSLAFRFYSDVVHCFDIPASCFTPVPEVGSSTIRMSFHADRELPSKALQDFMFEVIALAFSQRRKTLMHLLRGWRRINISREELEGIFKELGFAGMIRGEEILLKDYLSLAELLIKKTVPARKRKSLSGKA